MLSVTRGARARSKRCPIALPPEARPLGLTSFEIVLVRSKEGVEFEADRPLVHAMFVMAASPAERNFYLKALMAVAEIAQEPEFDRKWLRAASVDALREVVLAAERRRELEHGESSPG